MTKPNHRENFNLNTVLLAAVLGLSGWTLKKVSDLGETQAAFAVQIRNLERVVYGARE